MVVYLIGFMGSGKSGLGKRLAGQLGCEYMDADIEIERQYGQTIPEIFENEGEERFRQLETEWLEALDVTETVVSLGGGAPCSDHNIQLIKSKGKSVYLSLPPAALVSRLINSKTRRPLIEKYGNDKAALLEFVKKKLEEREPYYLQATLHFDAGNVNAEKIGQLAKLLKMA